MSTCTAHRINRAALTEHAVHTGALLATAPVSRLRGAEGRTEGLTVREPYSGGTLVPVSGADLPLSRSVPVARG
jgi:hypothetical protein